MPSRRPCIHCAASSESPPAYGYEIDDRLASESGTLASTILPASVNSGTGRRTSYDEASNFKSDAAYS
jgi:hypothetical protein